MIEEECLKHSDEVIHYDEKEENYAGMGLSIRYDNEVTAEYATVKRIFVREDGKPVGNEHNNTLMDTIK